MVTVTGLQPSQATHRVLSGFWGAVADRSWLGLPAAKIVSGVIRARLANRQGEVKPEGEP